MVTSVRTGPAVVKEAGGFIQETINVPGTLKRTTTTYPVPTSATSGGVGGNDVLLGGLGNDVTHGGAGDDQMWGNRSFDANLVPTKETSPTGISGLDDDVLFGGHGADRVWGGWQHDRMYGGHGDDRLDLVTSLNGVVSGDKTVDFKGIDYMYGGWGQDGMQADVSKPSPSNQTDKMVDGTGAYNGYFVCEGAYGGNSVMRLLSPAMETLLAAGRGRRRAGLGHHVEDVGLVGAGDGLQRRPWLQREPGLLAQPGELRLRQLTLVSRLCGGSEPPAGSDPPHNGVRRTSSGRRQRRPRRARR